MLKKTIYSQLVGNFASFELNTNVFILVATKWKETNNKKMAQIW